MKKTILSLTSIFMILTLLINTVGITVYPHFCDEEGEVSINFSIKENCCEDKHQELKVEKKHACCQKDKSTKELFQSKKDGCCTQESFTAQWQLNEFSVAKHIQIILPSFIIEKLLIHYSLTKENNFISQKTGSPPLFYSGREILSFKQSFLI